MNNVKKIFFLALSAILLLSCENGDNNNNNNNNLPNEPEETICYTGTMHVDQNDDNGTIFTQEGVEVDYEIHDAETLNFVMHDVKFSENMPITLNEMIIEGVSYTKDGDVYTLSGDGIVPYVQGRPFEMYTLTQIVGTITDDAMTLSFLCGEYPVTYEGTR